MELPLKQEEFREVVEDLLRYENTQGFSSLLSYRIPILWEALFLSQIKILSKFAGADAAPTSSPGTC